MKAVAIGTGRKKMAYGNVMKGAQDITAPTIMGGDTTKASRIYIAAATT